MYECGSTLTLYNISDFLHRLDSTDFIVNSHNTDEDCFFVDFSFKLCQIDKTFGVNADFYYLKAFICKLYDFVGKKNSLDDRAYEVERLESRLIMDGKSIEEVETEINRERDNLAKEMDELVKSFIQTNYENVLGPGVFIMLCNGFPYPLMTPLLEEIVDNAPETFKNHGLIKEYVDAARSNLEILNAER